MLGELTALQDSLAGFREWEEAEMGKERI